MKIILKKGVFIKWNPAVKTATDRQGLWQALLEDRLDVIATDHAPHTLEEKKQQNYRQIPSGAPMVQHSLLTMLECVYSGKISIEKVVEKMCHNPAILFNVKERGFVREGFFADLVLVDDELWKVSKDTILYKCGWSPLENTEFHNKVTHTFVNGHLAYEKGKISPEIHSQRILFDRN